MNRQLILALALVSIGTIGLIAVGCQTQSVTPFNNPQGYNFPGGMMGGSGMMGPGGGMMGGGMMGGRGYGYGYTPNENATPAPATRSVDRETQILVRNFQFDPARVVVKQGEAVRFTFTNQDSSSHNFGSASAQIPFILLPANGIASTVWVTSQKGTYTAFCTLHPGMQLQIVVE